MSYLRDDTLVLCFCLPIRIYGCTNLICFGSFGTKKLGRIVVIGSRRNDDVPCADLIQISPDELRDEFRTPFDIVFPQLLAYRLSLGAGLDPDNPSPEGVITRVVQGVRKSTNRKTTRKTELDCVVAGEANVDLLMDGVLNLEAGKEKLASSMDLVLGGSSAITAHNLASLGSGSVRRGRQLSFDNSWSNGSGTPASTFGPAARPERENRITMIGIAKRVNGPV